MRYLIYILLLVIAEASFAEMPKILKHSRRVYKAPAGASVLYRVRIKNPKQDGLKVKWYVDGEEKCARSKCLITAGENIEDNKRIYLLVTNPSGSSFARLSLRTKEGKIEKKKYIPKLVDFKKEEKG